VLLVAGMALMLVFAIGGQSARTGFALGRRALGVADGQVTEDQLRGLIRSLVLAPAGADARALGLVPFAGGPSGFSGGAVLARAGLCGPAGPAGRLSVAVEARPEGDVVTCASAVQPATVVADFRPRHVRFAYSLDGASWRDAWAPPPPSPFAVPGAKPPRAALRLLVRLASDDGRVDIVELAQSGPPSLYPETLPHPGRAE